MNTSNALETDSADVADPLFDNDWELSCVANQELSRRVAWRVAAVSAAVALAEAVAIVVLTPLHSIVPYVISVDHMTGDSRVVPAAERVLGANELNDKHWIAQFVVARQRYVFPLLQHDYDTVRRLADAQVWSSYASLYEGDNALDKKLHDTTELLPEILSVTLNEPGIATVRLQIEQRNAAGQTNQQRYIASLRYQFKLPPHARESDLIENPFGFVVTAYHLDEELRSAS